MATSRFVRALAGLLLILPSPAFGQSRPAFPIAYISLQRILTESDDAKAGAKELETLRVTRAQELNARKKALDDTKLQVVSTLGVFSRAKHAQLLEQQRRQESELQQATQQAQRDFEELQKKVQDRLRAGVAAVVTTLSKERGIVYVLNQDTSVVLAPSGADWTSDVLQRMNAASAAKERSGNTADKPGAKTP